MTSGDFKQDRFDLISEFANLSLAHDIPLNDPQAGPKLSTLIGSYITDAVSDDAVLHGKRTEAMFEALLVSLGRYSLLTCEDKGRVHSDGSFHPPDYRIVLLDGSQWLIEVKNVYIEDPFRQVRRLMKPEYLNRMQNYASATGGELKLAVYWARWGIWTLVSPGQLTDAHGGLTLDLETGMRFNELGVLGDRMIGTRPPLRLRLEADADEPASVGADGKIQFTIGDARIFCYSNEISDPIEKQIAWIFIQYGEWREVGPVRVNQDGQFKAIEYSWEPESRANRGFEIIGSLSRMFSRYYSTRTLQDHQVVQLHAPLRPNWLQPLIAADYESKNLPLWRFQMKTLDSS